MKIYLLVIFFLLFFSVFYFQILLWRIAKKNRNDFSWEVKISMLAGDDQKKAKMILRMRYVVFLVAVFLLFLGFIVACK
jgi:hypothetical protein